MSVDNIGIEISSKCKNGLVDNIMSWMEKTIEFSEQTIK